MLFLALLFNIYCSSLIEIVEAHLPEVHSYADDSQLHLSVSPGIKLFCQDVAVRAMEACIAGIKKWTQQNSLMLNDDKTEYRTRQQLDKVNVTSIRVGNHLILLLLPCNDTKSNM